MSSRHIDTIQWLMRQSLFFEIVIINDYSSIPPNRLRANRDGVLDINTCINVKHITCMQTSFNPTLSFDRHSVYSIRRLGSGRLPVEMWPKIINKWSLDVVKETRSVNRLSCYCIQRYTNVHSNFDLYMKNRDKSATKRFTHLNRGGPSLYTSEQVDIDNRIIFYKNEQIYNNIDVWLQILKSS